MAKIVLGGLASQVSGAVGGIVFSRNRSGAYIRSRVHPTISQTAFALDAKATMGAVSREWGVLTDAQRMAWATWAANNPVTDRMGMKQILAGNAAYMKLNGRLACMGIASSVTPPVLSAPPALETAVLTADIGAGDFEIDFTATPLAATHCAWVEVAVTEGLNQAYVKNRLKFIGCSAAALVAKVTAITQPADYAMTLELGVIARFGTLVVGQLVTCYVSVVSNANGQVSSPMVCSALVTTT
jgi:hypothetical protein